VSVSIDPVPRDAAASSGPLTPVREGLGALVVLASVLAAVVFGVMGATDQLIRVVGLSIFGLVLFAAALPVAALLHDREVFPSLKRSWAILALAFGCLAVAFMASSGLLGAAGRSLRDPLHLLFHPLVFVAVATLPCGLKTVLDRVRLMLDVVVTSGAMATLTLLALPHAYAPLTSFGTELPAGVGMVGDAMVLAAAITLWLRGAVSRWADPLAPLALAAIVHVGAQLAVGGGDGNVLSRVGYGLNVVPFALLGLAATRHRASLITVGILCGTTRRLSYLPTVAAGAALSMLLWASVTPTHEPSTSAVVSAIIVGLAALLRQILGLRQELDEREQHAMEAADRRLAALVHYGGDMLSIVDPDSTVRYASPSHRRIMGLSPETLVGRRLIEQVHSSDLAAAESCITLLMQGHARHESCVVRLRDGAGRWRWIESVATNLMHEPSIGGIVINSRDVTERKEMESRLLEQALLDPLTQLGNRRLLSDRLSHALARRARRSSDVALLLLDLDHFKFVNDTLGHANGDVLLVAVAARLRGALRSEDTIARLGGDEFAVLLEDLERADEADATAERIQRALEQPFLLAEREVFVRASIGIAWATDGQSVDDLLTDADVAMYSAKSAGRGCTERYSSEMRASVAERLEVEADLRHALQRDELDLHYQPVIHLETGRIVGAEALIRWRHPVKGVMLPLRFIPVAEESELIVSIGQFVLKQAARDAARFRACAPDATTLRVAVNLSARHFLSPHLVQEVSAVLANEAIPGSALAIELTETVLADNEAVIAERLQSLRDLGVCIALDDFGTGYSSLNYVRRFPIDILKVDKSFVSGVGHDSSNDGVTRAIVSIGRSLSLRTVAEGVETIEQMHRLRDLGCLLAQGYLFSPPVSREAFESLLQHWDGARFATPPALTLATGEVYTRL
jgi:diguanylate cyclase (GGDEF)-like protein/PAS domain S-box-containing protein